MIRRDFRNMERTFAQQMIAMVLKDALQCNASHIAVLWDGPEPFRYKIYPQYKSTRGSGTTPEFLSADEVGEEVPDIDPYDYKACCIRALVAAGIKNVQQKTMEADDLLASGAIYLASLGHRVFLATHDKDLMQVVSELINLFWPGSKDRAPRFITPKDVWEEKGVHPSQIRDYLCLLGDKVDDIPGTPGIGPDNACKILNEFGSIKAALKSKEPSAYRTKLRENIDQLHLAKSLVELVKDCWEPKIESLEVKPADTIALSSLVWKLPDALQEFSMNTRLAKSKGLFF